MFADSKFNPGRVEVWYVFSRAIRDHLPASEHESLDRYFFKWMCVLRRKLPDYVKRFHDIENEWKKTGWCFEKMNEFSELWGTSRNLSQSCLSVGWCVTSHGAFWLMSKSHTTSSIKCSTSTPIVSHFQDFTAFTSIRHGNWTTTDQCSCSSAETIDSFCYEEIMQWVFLWPPVPVTTWMCHVGGWGRENSLRYRHSPGYGTVEEGMERLLEASQCVPCPTLSTILWWWGLAPKYLLWSGHKAETDCSTTIQKWMKSIIRFIDENK